MFLDFPAGATPGIAPTGGVVRYRPLSRSTRCCYFFAGVFFNLDRLLSYKKSISVMYSQ
jgi:hypothetical protein